MAPPEPVRARTIRYEVTQFPGYEKDRPAVFMVNRVECTPVAGSETEFHVVGERYWDHKVDGTIDAYQRYEGRSDRCSYRNRDLERTHYLADAASLPYQDSFSATKTAALQSALGVAQAVAAKPERAMCQGWKESASLYMRTETHDVSIYVRPGRQPVLTGVKIMMKDEDSTFFFVELVAASASKRARPANNSADYAPFLAIYRERCAGGVTPNPEHAPGRIHYQGQ